MTLINHPLATNSPSLSPLAAFLTLDQLAFVARTDEDVAQIKKMFRLQDAAWTVDEVEAHGYVRGAGDDNKVGRNSVNHARLEFNYDLGVELEILRYTDGYNYPDQAQVPSCTLAHIGFHVDKGEQIPMEKIDWVFASPIIQQVRTVNHTNPFLVETGRKYQYTIYDTKPVLGTFLKVIERIEAQ